MLSVIHTQNPHDRIALLVVIALEFLCLSLANISIGISILVAVLILGVFLLTRFPEMSLGFALCGNVFLRIAMDFAGIPVSTQLTVISLAILGFAAIIYSMQKTQLRPIKLGYIGVFALLICGLLILGLGHSTDKFYGISKIVRYITFNLPLLFFPFLFRYDFEKLSRVFLWGFMFGFVIAVITSYLALHSSQAIRFAPSENVNPIWLARALGIGVLSGLYVFQMTERRLFKVILILLIPLFLYPAIKSGSRGPFLGIPICILLFFFANPAQTFRKKLVIFCLVGVISTLYLLTTETKLTERLLNPSSGDIASTAFRIIAWIEAANNFLSSPLMGIGTGSFYIKLLTLELVYPHNLVLEFAAEQGIAGLLAILGFLFFSLKFGYKNIKLAHNDGNKQKLNLALVAFSIFMFTLWNAMFSGDINGNETVWFMAGYIWILFVTLSETGREKSADDSHENL